MPETNECTLLLDMRNIILSAITVYMYHSFIRVFLFSFPFAV